MTTGRINQVTAERESESPRRRPDTMLSRVVWNRCARIGAECVLAWVSHLSVSSLCAGVRTHEFSEWARLDRGPAGRRLRSTGTCWFWINQDEPEHFARHAEAGWGFAVPSVQSGYHRGSNPVSVFEGWEATIDSYDRTMEQWSFASWESTRERSSARRAEPMRREPEARSKSQQGFLFFRRFKIRTHKFVRPVLTSKK